MNIPFQNLIKTFLLLSLCTVQLVSAQDWKGDYEDALNTAQHDKKPLILVFSGSDWCGPCIRLKKKVLESETFSTYADDNYVLYNADFPRKKKNLLPKERMDVNKRLAEKFNPNGYFPLVVVLDSQESVLGKTGFDKKLSPEKYIGLLNSFVK